uniref:hypothetical protein n=1 Tax=Pseudonocardia pini TaxID=2758030 RepID=UPI0015EFF541
GRVGRLFAVLVAAAVVVGGAFLVMQALGQSPSNPGGSTSTRPASSGGSSGSGLTGSALVTWSIGVEYYTATISVDPTSGIAEVTVENSPMGTYQIRQDLSYDAATGRYVGSDVRDPDTGRAVSLSVYEPDIFVLGPGTGGLRTVVQVCGSTTCYQATTTPL